jgi:Cysteine rich repeat
MAGRVFPAMLVAAAALAAQAAPAQADLMAACAPEIERYCGNVDRGRGRISACLASRSNDLGSGCLPEVEAVANSRLVPGDVRKIFDPGFRAALPQACERDAAQLCPGIATGDGRIFACLYAHTNRVDQTCSTEAQATLKQAN